MSQRMRTRPPFGYYVHTPPPEVRAHPWLYELYRFILAEKETGEPINQSRVVAKAAQLGQRLGRGTVPEIVRRAEEWNAGNVAESDDPFEGL